MTVWRLFLGLVLLLSLVRADTDVLPPEKAFLFSVDQKEGKFFAKISLPKDIYLLDDSLELSVLGKGVELESVVFPDAVAFGNKSVFWKEAGLVATVAGKPGTPFELILSYEGCPREGKCYGQREHRISLTVPKPVKIAQTAKFIPEAATASSQESQPLMEQDIIARILERESLLVILATFFGFGLLLSFTPCVFPMIPILSSLIICSRGEVSARRGFFLSLIYVLSISVTYAIAGILAALSGASIQAAFQVDWVLILFSGVFIALALAMFGLYDLQMPKWLQVRLKQKSDCAGGCNLMGVAVMGVLSALIIGPCVAAPLAGALLYIGQNGDVLLGGLALFVLSMGMGVPLFVLGAGAGRFIPQPGPWMNTIKNFFGLLLLGVAISLLSRILSDQHTLMAWAVLFVGTGLLMGAFEPLRFQRHNFPQRLQKAVAALFFIYGLILAIGAFGGGTSMIEPLKPYAAKEKSDTESNEAKEMPLNFAPVASSTELQEKLPHLKKPLLLYFTAQWCSNCKEFRESVLSQEDVAKALDGFELCRVDVTANTDADIMFMKQYKLFGPPGMIFYDVKGKELSGLRMVGYENKKDFLRHIALVKSALAQAP